MNEINQSALNDKEIIPENPADVIQSIYEEDYDWLTKQIATLFGFSGVFIVLSDGQQSQLKSYSWKKEQLPEAFLLTLSATVYGTDDFRIIESLSTQYAGNTASVASSDFFVGIPLKTKAGATIGALGLLNEKMPPAYTEDLLGQLRILVTLVMDNVELRYAQKSAESSQKIVNRKFTHDLRNPLTVISLNAEIIKMEANLPDSIKEMCDQVKQATSSMNQLIDDFSAIQKNAR